MNLFLTSSSVPFAPTSASLDWGTWIAGFIAIAVAALIVFAIVGLKSKAAGAVRPWADAAHIGALCAVFPAFVLTAMVIGVSFQNSADGRSAHYAAVAGWLQSDYGIQADKSQVKQLLSGRELITEVGDSGSIAVSVSENVNGDAALVDAGRQVIAPLDR